MSDITKGQCLCGAVQFEAVVPAKEMAVCHCSMCRKWSGGSFLVVEAESLAFTQDADLGVYSSSEWGERCFCTKCGSSLVWRAKGGGHFAVSAQSLEGMADAPLKTQIFIDEKPEGYDFAQQTHNMTGAEVFAQFMGEGEA